MRIELPIGGKFYFGCKKYICIEDANKKLCFDCAFIDFCRSNEITRNLACAAGDRLDQKNVVFKEQKDD